MGIARAPRASAQISAFKQTLPISTNNLNFDALVQDCSMCSIICATKLVGTFEQMYFKFNNEEDFTSAGPQSRKREPDCSVNLSKRTCEHLGPWEPSEIYDYHVSS